MRKLSHTTQSYLSVMRKKILGKWNVLLPGCDCEIITLSALLQVGVCTLSSL